MFIKYFKISLGVLTFILVACDINDPGRSFTESPATIETVSHVDTVSLNEVFTINVMHTGYACDHYSRHTIIQHDKTCEVVVFNKREKDAVCDNEIIRMETRIEMQFTTIGMHKLLFRQSESSFLTDSVFVIGD